MDHDQSNAPEVTPSPEAAAAPHAPDAPETPALLAPLAPGAPRMGRPDGVASIAPGGRNGPSYVFLMIVSVVSLVADVGTKLWAEKNLADYKSIEVLPGHFAFNLARNKGGAWGLLGATSENVRRPFFLLVSAAAVAFIVTLYRRLGPQQKALKWGLPLVLGGALGNVFDRIRYGWVIDFIDFHMTWQGRDHHWPTFNVADIAICVGVGLMALDMFTSRRGHPRTSMAPPAPPPAGASGSDTSTAGDDAAPPAFGLDEASPGTVVDKPAE
ncbi:MAG: signal peptidase II [Polyangiaceae bacterium]